MSENSQDENLKSQVEKLEEEVKNLKELVGKEVYKINQEMQNKVSFEDLGETETRIMEKVMELFESCMTKFHLKEEINKRLSIINKKIRELGDGRLNSNEREDAMLSKKNLGPIACASCE